MGIVVIKDSKNMPVYEVLAVVQGTEAWKQERLKRVTSTQTCVLLNVSPYQTPAELLEEKLTGREIEVSSYKQYLFQKGHDAELAAREWVESHLKIKFPPYVVLSKEHELLASLDGFNIEKNIILEAKFMGKKSLDEVKAGKIKSHHVCQVQAQLLATGAEKCVYFATTEDGDSAITEIKPDAKYAANISSAVSEFMNGIKAYEKTKAALDEIKENILSKYIQKRPKGELCAVRRRR